MRPFTAEPGHTQDFFAVRDFLVRINAREVRTPGFLWGRWEWAFALPYLDTSALDRIGVAERDGRVVALATYEESPGDAWLVVDPAHRDLLPALVAHALDRLSVDGRLRVMVPDHDAGVETGEAVTHAEVLRVFAGNIERLKSLLRRVIAGLPDAEADATATCSCRRALDGFELPFELP